MQQFLQTNYNDWNREKQLELELATATASILPENMDDTHLIQVLSNNTNVLDNRKVLKNLKFQ